jgi:hypothetical protein
VEPVLGSVARMLEGWKILLKDDKRTVMEDYIGKLELLGARVPRIMGAMEGSSLGVSHLLCPSRSPALRIREGVSPCFRK